MLWPLLSKRGRIFNFLNLCGWFLVIMIFVFICDIFGIDFDPGTLEKIKGKFC